MYFKNLLHWFYGPISNFIRRRRCVSEDLRCDGHDDCLDESDERNRNKTFCGFRGLVYWWLRGAFVFHFFFLFVRKSGSPSAFIFPIRALHSTKHRCVLYVIIWWLVNEPVNVNLFILEQYGNTTRQTYRDSRDKLAR